MSSQVRIKLAVCLLMILSSGGLFALKDNRGLLESLTNYPNPFDSRREGTWIAYQIPQDLPVRVGIYDLFGYKVREFRFMPGEEGARAGANRIRWDGTDETGRKVSKGGYVCQVVVEGDLQARGVRKIGVIH